MGEHRKRWVGEGQDGLREDASGGVSLRWEGLSKVLCTGSN